jgi:hypothetical protein
LWLFILQQCSQASSQTSSSVEGICKKSIKYLEAQAQFWYTTTSHTFYWSIESRRQSPESSVEDTTRRHEHRSYEK